MSVEATKMNLSKIVPLPFQKDIMFKVYQKTLIAENRNCIGERKALGRQLFLCFHIFFLMLVV